MEVAPVGIELHGIIIDAGILAHAAAARLYHLLKQRPKLLAPGLCVAGKHAEIDYCALADLTFRIAPVLRETVVVVLLYRPVWPLPVFWYLTDEHGGKGSDFFPDSQAPGGPTGGGKRDEGRTALAFFSENRGITGTCKHKTQSF